MPGEREAPYRCHFCMVFGPHVEPGLEATYYQYLSLVLEKKTSLVPVELWE